ncbi:MAG: DNA repair protein RadA [Clostridia bacterium]|nr:DNA repair protein RadA [Clostridia bacterium]MBQ5648525.1 DNA repair protein RadA [Clostridia bacterium]MBQ5809091.1 DNA repair protein RadA [Clostridia bacterium]
MKNNVAYICRECGAKSMKWLGKCPTCGSWDSFDEEEYSAPAVAKPRHASLITSAVDAIPQKITDGGDELVERTLTGVGEFDRVLGGGIVAGSVVLLSGEPGIGKSTLLLQIFARAGKDTKVLYVSGEESFSQIKMRAKRLGIEPEGLYLYTETDVTKILAAADKLAPDYIVVDSIQTVYDPASPSAPGSINQVKGCAAAFVSRAKNTGCAVLLVGHVNKEGGISGPKVLEHIVDAVIHFEGDRTQAYRMVRAVKNRFGSTNEIGVFEMTERGLSEVENPSETLMSEATEGVSGCAAVCVMEGTRPIIAEIQALVTPTVFPAARRNANGVDYNRLCLIIAVLEKRLGLKFYQNDVYINVTGGLRLDTPSADVAIALALISSITDRPVKNKTLCFGELGLAGECRAASFAEIRIKEAKRLGFETVIIPKKNKEKMVGIDSEGVMPVGSVYELLTVLKQKND